MESKKFKQLLIEKEISQRKLAAEIGLSARSLCDKVNGKKRFRIEEVIKICDILGIEDIREYFD